MLKSVWIFMRRIKAQSVIVSILILLISSVLTACTMNSSPAPVRDAGSKNKSHHGSTLKRTNTPSTVVNNTRTPISYAGTERPKLLPGTTYTVKAGDTLYAIAWMYGVDVRSLAEQNGLDANHHVRTGQVIHYSLPDNTQEKQVSIGDKTLPDHRVKVGDSLSVLAEKNGFRLADLGAFNHIKAPYVIHPGQIIHFPAQQFTNLASDATSSPAFVSKDSFSEERALDQNSIKSNKESVVDKKQTDYSDSTKQIPNKLLTWRWPTKGSVVGGYSAGEQSNKGIDISGKRGQSVVAAASGRVVYAGNALRGYGNLIIIKHNEDYLSAYAHNDTLRVTEQQVVKAGQKIADMGSSESSDVRLHFEIRYRGQSVNPLRYLPKR
jgi:lipoprotein NlpD